MMIYNSSTHEFAYSGNSTTSIIQLTVAEEVMFVAILSIIICASLYGNCIMIIVLYQNDKMWTPTYLLIGNLAMSGLVLTLFSMPFSLATIIVGNWPFGGIMCTIVAFINSELLLATIFTHTMISVGKYFAVVKPFSRAMTVPRTKKLISAIWLIAGIMTVGPLFKFGRYSFGPTTLACGIGFPQNKVEILYLLILATIGFIIPNLVMGHVYLKVFLSVRQHSKRLKAAAHSTGTSSHNCITLQRKLAITAVTSLLCLILCWTPFCVFILMALIVKSRDMLPHSLGIWAYWCGFSYNALNPIIISFMCQRFRDGVRNTTLLLLRIPIKCCRLLRDTCCACRFKADINCTHSANHVSAHHNNAVVTNDLEMKYRVSNRSEFDSPIVTRVRGSSPQITRLLELSPQVTRACDNSPKITREFDNSPKAHHV